MKLIDSRSIGHEEIYIYETEKLFDERGRFLILQFADEAVQGAIDLMDKERIIFEYPKALIHLIESNRHVPAGDEDLFIIGHGIGTLASYFSNQNCISVDIDEAIVELSRQYFAWQGDNVRIGDGRALLEQEQGIFDYIVLDAFTSSGVPSHLCTIQFFTLVYSKLKSDGALLINVTGKGKNDVKSGAIYRTLQEVFEFTYGFTLPSSGERDIRNSILIGSKASMSYKQRDMAGFERYHPDGGYVLYD